VGGTVDVDLEIKALRVVDKARGRQGKTVENTFQVLINLGYSTAPFGNPWHWKIPPFVDDLFISFLQTSIDLNCPRFGGFN